MKRILVIAMMICTLFCIGACKKNNTPITHSVAATIPTTPTVHTTEPTKAPLHRQELSKGEKLSMDVILENFGAPWDFEAKLDIPVYYESDLLFDIHNDFDLTRDASRARYFGSMPNSVKGVYAELPTNAWRVREDGSSYAVYDTDTGYRFYLFFLKDSPQFTGYPVVIKKNVLLSYTDFKNIQIGDPIEKIESIDIVTSLHKKELLCLSDFYTSSVIKRLIDEKLAPASIHYLKDGILKIEYTSPSDGVLTVYSITFYEDFIIPTLDGELTSHKIKDIDLPVT